MRTTITTLSLLGTALAFALLPTAPASARAAAPMGAGSAASAGAARAAAQELRFWGYWTRDGSSWAFATTGPAQAKPDDGAVEGWRFALSKGEQGTPPRAEPDFDEICRGEKPGDGEKRVAVVIDYGEDADAPAGQKPPEPTTGCAVLPESATGADALAAVAEPQTDDKGLICAIDAYPAQACGTQPAPAASSGAAQGDAREAETGGAAGGTTGLIGGLVVILAVAAAGVYFAVRRRRAAGPPSQ